MNAEFQQEILKIAKQIATQRFAPLAVERDQKHLFPRDNMRVLGEADFHELPVAQTNGGIGFGRTELVSVIQELAQACASTALVYVSHLAAIKAIELGGQEEIRKKWFSDLLKGKKIGAFAVHEPECGSNSGAITTRAVKHEKMYLVNGTKFFITSAEEAEAYIVLVRNDPEKGAQGISTLLIEKDTPGLTFGEPEDKMGLTGTSSREMFLRNCEVPVENLIGQEGEGIPMVGKTLVGWGFFGAAAISAGIARAATERAIQHAKTRTIAGQPIAVHQAVQAMITEMALKTDAIETLLERCARHADSTPEKIAFNAFKAKLFASETAIDVANLAIQVMGGHGYCREYHVERLFRDARGLTLHFKTSEWLRQDIAKILIGI